MAVEEAAGEAAEELAAEEEVEVEGEVPAWLAELAVEEAGGEAAEELAAEEEVEVEEEIPAWLAALGAAGVVARGTTAGEPPVEEEAAEEVVAEEKAPPAVRGPVEAGGPAGLQALSVAGLEEAEPEAAMTEISPGESGGQQAEEMPDWLREVVDEKPAVEPLTSLAGAVGPQEAAALEPEEEAMPEAPAPPPAMKASDAAAVSADVPDSLRALAEAGLLDESELEEALSAMTPEELAAQPVEEVPAWLSSLLAEEEAAAAVDAPAEEWTAERRPGLEVEAEALAREGVPGEEEGVPVGRRGPEAEVEAPVEEVSAAEETPVEEQAVPDWLPGPKIELEPPVEEAAPEEVPAWVREMEAGALETRPTQGEAAPPEMPEASATEVGGPPGEVEEAAVPEELAEEVPPPEMPEAAVIEVGGPPGEVEEAADEAPSSRVDELLAQVRSQPRDYGTRLELARLHREAGDWNASLSQYEKLVNARKHLPTVIGDLKAMAGEDLDRVRLYQLLGDALMQEGQLDDALAMYRQARQALVR